MKVMLAVVWAAVGASVPAGPGCDTSPPPAASAEVVEWLDRLEARGRDIRSLQADVVHDKVDELLADRQTRTGEVFYLAGSGPGSPPRFAVVFRRFVADSKLHHQQLEFIFDGVWLVEKDHKQKRFEKRQVVAPGEESKLDPLSIDGPFPLPLGQKRDRVLERFDVTLVREPRPDEPPDSVHLRLTPRPDAPVLRDQKRFDAVDLWFDRQTLLPVRVRTDEGAAVTTVTLSNVRVNEADESKIAGMIDTNPPKGGWRVEIKPWNE